MDVVGRYREAVRLVLRPFEVGEVDDHLVTDVHLDRFRRDVRADQRTEDFDPVALLDDLLLAGTDGTRVRLVGTAVGTDLVANAGLQLAGFDGDDVVRLAERQRHVVEELHLVFADVDQLVVLRMQRADRHEAIDRQLVQRHQVTALGIDRVTLHRHQVADVVVHADLVEHLAFAEVPLDDLRIDVERSVGDARLRVVLRVQWAEAELHLRVQRILHADHRDAVGIRRFEPAGLDRRLDLLERVDRDVRVELAGNGDELAVGSDIDAVRRLRLGHQEEHALLHRRVHHQHVVTVDLLRPAGGNQLGSLLPVDHMQVVGVLRRAAGFIGRPALLDAADVTLAAERVGERPAVGRPLAGVGQVLAVGWQFDRERLLRIDAALLAVELPVGDAAAVLLVELLEREELLVLQRCRVLRRLDHVLGVRRDEGTAVFGLEDRVDDDLLGLEVAQVDHRQPRVRLVVDEQELAVVLALRLRDRRVVRVAPGDFLAVDPTLRQDGFRAFVEAVALPGLGSEHTDVLENAHRGDAIDDHLPGLAAG
ncbi:MAG: hypothetical protein FAZ92_02125 [Accumulibacter sp.]|nr:MAG: hypothetical protein FAZ92_02125 [Accumulibacter sp.]